ncbi:MAG: NAD(P)/FAD-dependent oxidoreductase [Acutalibacteraceae bacterium]
MVLCDEMRKYDVIIVGASTTGSWFAKKISENGFKVLLIEKQKKEDVSRDYDIFHMATNEMEKFGLTIPEKTDSDYAFEFVGGAAYSAFGNYPKPSHTHVTGLHKHEYIMRMNREALKAGAEIEYSASFSGCIFDDSGRITGITYQTEEGVKEAYCSLVADCSGISAAVRTSLPDTSAAENFKLTPRDLLYVILYYVRFRDDHPKTEHTDSFLQYKCWSAPSDDPKGGILGVGANLSFDYAEEMFGEFRRRVPIEPYTVQKIEKSITPYHRPPYSMVDDGFIAMGDAACLNKPNNGEGCISALYQAQIAVEVVSEALKEGGYLTKERLWSINTRYIEEKGKMSCALRAALIGAAAMTEEENEYLFKNDVIFSQKIMSGLDGGISLSLGDVIHHVRYISKAALDGSIRKEYLKDVYDALKRALAIYKIYSDYPETPEGLSVWSEKADGIWADVGTMADKCDKSILERSEKRLRGEKVAFPMYSE